MPVPSAAPFELVLADSSGPATVVKVTSTAFEVVPDGVSAVDRTFLDTADARLRDDGLVLEQTGGGPGEPVRLTLLEGGSPARQAQITPARGDRLLLSDIPDGPVRSRLAPVVDVRALLPQARVRSRLRSYRLLNRDRKTVVRLVIEQADVRRRSQRAAHLRTRVRLLPVRGYGRALAKARAALESAPELELAKESLVNEAITVAGGEFLVTVDPAAGLRPDLPAVAAAAVVCLRLADVVEANLPGTLADLDTEFLHDLRVAVRRSRSVLRELKSALPAEETRRVRETLRWVQQLTGPTRDLDVHLLEWDDTVATLREATAADLALLRRALEQHRDEAFVALRRALRGSEFKGGWAEWRSYLEALAADAEPRGLPLAKVAGRRIRNLYGRMVADGSEIDADSPPQALHELRKRGKELRYLLEHFGPLWPPEAVKPLVSALKGLQDVLGRFQDRQVQADYLRGHAVQLVSEPGGTDALLALGLVLDRLADDQARAREAFATRFARFAAKDVTRSVQAIFRARHAVAA
ncbi:MAG: CHAD domain-containing protein [Acidimicrobiales bacterium]